MLLPGKGGVCLEESPHCVQSGKHDRLSRPRLGRYRIKPVFSWVVEEEDPASLSHTDPGLAHVLHILLPGKFSVSQAAGFPARHAGRHAHAHKDQPRTKGEARNEDRAALAAAWAHGLRFCKLRAARSACQVYSDVSRVVEPNGLQASPSGRRGNKFHRTLWNLLLSKHVEDRAASSM